MYFTLETDSEGLSKVLKDYQEEALKYIWSLKGEGATSREVWENVNKALRRVRTISRASIINFLNEMAEQGILCYDEVSGKGGFRRIYRAAMDEGTFKRAIAKTVIDSLLRDFPKETMEAILETYIRTSRQEDPDP